MRKILYFLGGRAREGGSAIYTRRRDRTCRACQEGSYEAGGSLVGADDGLLPSRGVTRCHDDENFGGQFPLDALRWKSAIWVRVVRSTILSAFLIVAYVELLRVFLILWRKFLSAAPNIITWP